MLDNCEHLIEACAQVAERVLRSAPRTRFLVDQPGTPGRGGEALFAVPPLGVPGPQEQAHGQIAQSEAVQLFADRATAVQPAFVLDAGTAAAVAHICRRLDGIPLAIELAAARVRILPPVQIAARLDDRFGLLTSGNRGVLPRHQTLRAAIDWSYEPAGRAGAGALRPAVGVRRGLHPGGSRGGVRGRGAPGRRRCSNRCPAWWISPLSSPRTAGQARFRMLETLRRYAGRAACGVAGRPRSSGAGTRSASSGWPNGRSRCSAVPRQATWLRTLESDRDNLSAAMDWAFRRDPDVAVRLTSALAYFWLIGRHRSEVRQRLAEAVDKARGASPANRAKALTWAAMLADVEGRTGRGGRAGAGGLRALAGRRGPVVARAVRSGPRAGGRPARRDPRGRRAAGSEPGQVRHGRRRLGHGDSHHALGYVSAFTAARSRHGAGPREPGRLPGGRGPVGADDVPGTARRAGPPPRRFRRCRQRVSRRPSESSGTLDCATRSPSCSPTSETSTCSWATSRRRRSCTRRPWTWRRTLGARDAAALARSGLALAARRQGDYGRARELHLAGPVLLPGNGPDVELANSLASLGYVEELRGDLDAAEACHQESLRLTRDQPDASHRRPRAGGAGLRGRRQAAAAQGRRALGAAESVREAQPGRRCPAQERADVERATDAALSALGAQDLAGLLEQGRRMSVPDAATSMND